MFGWFKGKKRPENSIKRTPFPDDLVILGRIAGLVRGATTDKSILREVAQPNCAIVLDQRGHVSLRWISESDNVSDVISFVLVRQLSTFRELLETCVQEIKAGAFDEAFLGGPGLMLLHGVAIQALKEMKHAWEQIERQRQGGDAPS